MEETKMVRGRDVISGARDRTIGHIYSAISPKMNDLIHGVETTFEYYRLKRISHARRVILPFKPAKRGTPGADKAGHLQVRKLEIDLRVCGDIRKAVQRYGKAVRDEFESLYQSADAQSWGTPLCGALAKAIEKDVHLHTSNMVSLMEDAMEDDNPFPIDSVAGYAHFIAKISTTSRALDEMTEDIQQHLNETWRAAEIAAIRRREER